MAKEQAANTLGTGTDTLEVRGADPSEIDPNHSNSGDIRARFKDPNAARKAIISRHSALRQAEFEQDLDTVPGAKQLQDGYKEDEVATTDDGDAATVDGAMQPARGDPEPIAEDPTSGVDSPTQTQASRTDRGDENVTLKVFGKEIVESRAAVEAAGGKEARQIQLAAEERLRRGSEHLEHAEADARRAEELARVAADRRRAFTDLQKRLGDASRPTEPTPVTAADSSARQPVSVETPAPKGPVDQSQIENLVTELYSGDPERASAALSDVLQRVRGSPQMTFEQISALAQARFDTEWAEREAKAATQVQVDAVNHLMEDRYGDTIMAKGNEKLRRDVALLYNAEIADPKNRGRPLVVIADEVATRVLGRAGIVDAPNADVAAAVSTRTNFKRRIPQPSSATDRVPQQETAPAYPTSPRDVVNLLRAARGQPLIT
jgi:hypothetical protein